MENARRHPRASGGLAAAVQEEKNPYNRLRKALDSVPRREQGAPDTEQRDGEKSVPWLPWPLQRRASGGGLSGTHYAALDTLPDPRRSPVYTGASSERASRVAQRAIGGGMSYPGKQAAMRPDDAPYGLAIGTGGGRTDKNDISVGAGSYVLPADVVSGLGAGNTLGGAKVFELALNSMPWGISPPKSRGRHGAPAAPAPPNTQRTMPTFAEGGPADDADVEDADDELFPEVPIQAADGEITLSPEDVLRIGQYYAPDNEQNDVGAMMRRGHKILDLAVKHLRGRTIKHLRGLRGPVGSKEPSKGHI